MGSVYAREKRKSDQAGLVRHTKHMGDYCRGLTAHSTLSPKQLGCRQGLEAEAEARMQSCADHELTAARERQLAEECRAEQAVQQARLDETERRQQQARVESEGREAKLMALRRDVDQARPPPPSIPAVYP